MLLFAAPSGATQRIREAALYPQDTRREMGGGDHARYPGAGVLYCRRPDGVSQKAAAAWLVGAPDLVVLNAHNFRDRRLDVTREVADCYFQIGGRNYDFVTGSLRLGTAPGARSLHITDDWALLRLAEPVEGAAPQPIPQVPDLPVGPASLPVTMVSPAGHENFRGGSSLEACLIHQIDPPEEDAIRRVRHDCNNGYGGSGSGLFDVSGRMIALQSASLSMNSRRPFDVEFHYGSALLFEGRLLAALREAAGNGPPARVQP
ncbi:trypsin-like peptidase domain-containing protein [Methylobacterium durans]|uniref:serine protease n=1 Tax=Methylobacterium durans TaxID=2202825 RepID=UPI002AFF06C2|nr:serine protease [Methylobacterium durans]MEA1834415.1 trypsin-like peptidase domain-containing protein [Methylobacterium durans]